MKLWFISQNNVLENEHNSLSLNQTSLELSTCNNSWPTAMGVMQQRPVGRRLHIFYSAVLLRHDLHHLSIYAGAVSWTACKETRGHGGFIFLAYMFKAPDGNFRGSFGLSDLFHLEDDKELFKLILNKQTDKNSCLTLAEHGFPSSLLLPSLHWRAAGRWTASWSPRLGLLPPLPVRTVLGANEM